MKKNFVSLIACLTVVLISCSQMKKKVDLIIYSTTVYTVDSNFTVAQSFAVKDGKVVEVGTTSDIFNKYSAPNVYNGIGKVIVPGFIDGHCHFFYYGENLVKNADLADTKSFEEILGILHHHHQKFDTEWITGRGWDQNDWENKTWPNKAKLDELFPENPVVLTRIDGHAVLANSEALKRAGINPERKTEGGEILLDENGRMTGVLIDNAADLLKDYIPELSREEKTDALLMTQQKCFEAGLTSVVDAGMDKEDILLIDSLQKDGKLKMKVYAMLSPTEENFEHFLGKGSYVTDHLSVRSVKLYADGALGSRGALLTEPYADDPGNYGILINHPDYYREICQKAFDAGYQVNTHCIGDSGAKVILDIYSEFLEGKNDKRWRIEHAQIINPGDMNKFGKYSVIPSVQGTHATSDMYWAEDRLGPERIKWSYAFKELLEQNGWLINGTDFPIEKIYPIHTFYATVARKDLKGYPESGFLKENALNREETLKSMTIWAAKGSFEEDRKGSIEAGKDADFVILDSDIMQIPEKDIPRTRIVKTFVNGEEVYKNKDFVY